MSEIRILIVDDDAEMLEVCALTLKQVPNTRIFVEPNSTRAMARLEEHNIDLLVTDLMMPGLNGIELVRLAREYDPELTILVITGYPTIETAAECMKLGAVDYITKPFLPAELQASVRRLLEDDRLREENSLLRGQVGRSYAGGNILGESPGMVQVNEQVRRAASTDFDVLIIGETGTGKELVAHAIHERSRRRNRPFVPVDCGAIPEDLLESEFFGHERGAFTGAQNRSLGLMEFANQGTFFLDEISQMPLRLQAKLLRVLQERRIRRVGGTQEIELDLRILVASSLDLTEAVKRERFRLDLYHRVNVVRIDLPPLRERAADIPLLARSFLNRLTHEMAREAVEIAPEAMEVLMSYSWPGNVRELQNSLKRTLAACPQPVITVDDLPDNIVAQAGDSRLGGGGYFAQRERRLAAFEKEYFRNLLNACGGDVTAAARQAQLPRGTFYRLLKKHGMNATEFRSAKSLLEV